MKIILFTFFMLSTGIAYTQVQEETETPQWALLMYQEMESEALEKAIFKGKLVIR